MKIGLIQNEAVAGDLSRNLRQVVQEYRKCLDAGADLVIAPAQALDGAFLHDLSTRSSMRLQAQAALEALASETSLPLLLASCAGQPGSDAGVRPWLLCGGRVRALRNRQVVKLCEHDFFLDVGESPTPLPLGKRCDFILHLPCGSWWLGRDEAWRELAKREAAEAKAHVLLIQGVGYAEGKLMTGSSFVTDAQGVEIELPALKTTARTWRKGARMAVQSTATPPERLLQATCYSLRSAMHQGGYAALAVDASGAPHAPLLLALARLAVGARHTVALCHKGESRPYSALAGKCLHLQPMAAEEHDLLLLNGLSLRQLLLGEHPIPACIGGLFAPLGEMYDSELRLLQQYVATRLPDKLRHVIPPCSAATDNEKENELRRLVEDNAALGEILSTTPQADEAHLRRLLRRLAAAEAYRPGRPTPLHLRRHLVHLPAHHRHFE